MSTCQATFNKLLSLVDGGYKSEKPPSPTPHCIKDMTLKKFPCLVCAKLFDKIQLLVDHSSTHRFYENGDIYCCFCGMSFPSEVSLHLHQSSQLPVVLECSGCQEKLSQEESATHVCDNVDSEPQKHAKCPLSCNKEDLREDQLKTHLLLAHGCQSSSQIAQLKKDENSPKCPVCRQAFLDGPSLSLPNHIAQHCSAVSALPRESARMIMKQAKVNGLDPEVLLRQELESNLLHVLTLLEQVSKSEESESESVKYLTFLMHRTTNEKFQKLMCDAIDWSSDKILESFDDFKDDFPVLFDLWSISFEFSLQFEKPLGLPPNQMGKLMTSTVDNKNAAMDDMGLKSAEELRDKMDEFGPDYDILKDLIKEICS